MLDDEAFKPSLVRLTDASSKVCFAHAGRLMEVAKPYVGVNDWAEMAPFVPLFDKLVACFVTDERIDEFRMTAAVTGVPDISGLIEQLVLGELGEDCEESLVQLPDDVVREIRR